MSLADNTTVLHAVAASLQRAGHYNRGSVVAPAAILWPDDSRQWERFVSLLRAIHPALLTLGAYSPEAKTGPAVWIRCLLAGELDAQGWSADVVPVVYLPGVSRQMLRAVESCPRHLQPLAELQYRGVFWGQQNGRDWTLLSFLRAQEGLGLDVAQDKATIDALHRASIVLADTSVESLRDKRLEGADFDGLLLPDPVRDLLRWLNDHQATKGNWTPQQWEAFRSMSRDTYRFDPVTDGELVAAERLADKQPPWDAVWSRFVESPRTYPGIPRLLEQAHPQTLLFDRSCWPKANAQDEADLRVALLKLVDAPPHEARNWLRELEKQHGGRRQWAWHELGLAPLASALEHLAALAAATATALPGATPDAMASAYTSAGWKADLSVLQSLASVSRLEDVAAVRAAIQAAYKPWLIDTALRLQALCRQHGFPGYSKRSSLGQEAAQGEVVFFADGLRYDVGCLLRDELARRGFDATISSRWVGLPTVTPTCKPAVSPVASLVKGKDYNEDFLPMVGSTGKPLTTDRFRALLAEAKYEILPVDGTGDPTGRAWTEHGDLDHTGHEQGWKVAWRIREQVVELCDRVETLLDAGWLGIHVVTDHGWLLLPGGLPRAELPKYLVDTRWGRCAVLKGSTNTEGDVFDWLWSNLVRIALAPDVSCFKSGMEYAHGGLSLQECVTPNLLVRRGSSGSRVVIESLTWEGLRCRIRVAGAGAAHRVDVRLKPAAADTSIVEGDKLLPVDGSISLVVPDDDHLGSAAAVVVLDPTGALLAKRATTVGGGD